MPWGGPIVIGAAAVTANGAQAAESDSSSRNTSPDGTTLCTTNSGRLSNNGVRTETIRSTAAKKLSAVVGAVARHTASTRTGHWPDSS